MYWSVLKTCSDHSNFPAISPGALLITMVAMKAMKRKAMKKAQVDKAFEHLEC